MTGGHGFGKWPGARKTCSIRACGLRGLEWRAGSWRRLRLRAACGPGVLPLSGLVGPVAAAARARRLSGLAARRGARRCRAACRSSGSTAETDRLPQAVGGGPAAAARAGHRPRLLLFRRPCDHDPLAGPAPVVGRRRRIAAAVVRWRSRRGQHQRARARECAQAWTYGYEAAQSGTSGNA
jgi:hypothetical protein